MAELLIVGSGPAAAAAERLLRHLKHEPLILPAAVSDPVDHGARSEGSTESSPAGGSRHDPRILLPRSALDELGFLGLDDQARRRGVSVERVELRGDGAARGPAVESVALRESELIELLRGTSPEASVENPVPAVELLVAEGRVRGVTLADGGTIEAELTLCASGGLLAAASSSGLFAPPVVGPEDRVATRLLPLPPERFGADRHLLHTEPSGWGWALRLDDRLVQHSLFRGASSPAARPEDLPEELRDPDEPRSLPERRIRPSLPAELPPGLLPVGRAAYALHPMSSLGSAHALRSARLAAAVANTHLRSDRSETELAAWLHAELTWSALRAHALCALAFEDAAPGDAGYWRDRSNLSWALEAVTPELRAAARRVIELQRLHRAGTLLHTPFRARLDLQRESGLTPVGPMVRERPVLRAPGGLPLPAEEVNRLAPVLDQLRAPATLDAVLGRVIPVGPERDAAEQLLVRRVSRLYEAGILERAEA